MRENERGSSLKKERERIPRDKGGDINQEFQARTNCRNGGHTTFNLKCELISCSFEFSMPFTFFHSINTTSSSSQIRMVSYNKIVQDSVRVNENDT